MSGEVSIEYLIAGSLGGLLVATVTALLAGRRERGRQVRDRMLTAADDFGTGLQQFGREAEQMGAYYPAGRYFTDWREAAKAVC